MATGYTADIEKGISFREFVLRCARAMGACIMQRDEAMDEPPKQQEVSTYHKERIVEVKKELAELLSMTPEECDKKAKANYKSALEDIKRGIKKCDNLREKYQAMLKEVQAWKPPDSDFDGFKKFMVDQITESIRHDCGSDYYKDQKPVLLTGKEWRECRKGQLEHDISYHKKEHAEEVQRVNERNEWVRKLYKSLPKK